MCAPSLEAPDQALDVTVYGQTGPDLCIRHQPPDRIAPIALFEGTVAGGRRKVLGAPKGLADRI